MPQADDTGHILTGLSDAGVEYIVVGMTAGVMLGAPVVTFDVDILCELSIGEGFEQGLGDTVLLEHGNHRIRVVSLERLIAVKAKAGRAKDRLVLPVLIATLEEQRKRQS